MVKGISLASEYFSKTLEALLAPLVVGGKVAVGVSGGPDSMALAFLLSQWAEKDGSIEVHALTIDHALRAESKEEAKQVGIWVANWPHVTHTILTRSKPKGKSRIQEQARADRYALMSDYCSENGINVLFVAHHKDDQAETVLFRLAKGSGFDGLAGMAAKQAIKQNLFLIRPLLDFDKKEILSFCEAHNIPYVRDPSNEDKKFTRARLRDSMQALEREGLTADRLAQTAKRVRRARKALEMIAEEAYKAHVINKYTDRIELKLNLLNLNEEIGIRVVLKCINLLRVDMDFDENYGPRLNRVETLYQDLRNEKSFRRRTLAGLIFTRDDKKEEIIIEREHL